jgi:hypothetical protein
MLNLLGDRVETDIRLSANFLRGSHSCCKNEIGLGQGRW